MGLNTQDVLEAAGYPRGTSTSPPQAWWEGWGEARTLVTLAVAHEQFRVLGEGELAKIIKDCPVVVDVKGVYDFHHRAHRVHRERTETKKK